jgi:hypothetical protein
MFYVRFHQGLMSNALQQSCAVPYRAAAPQADHFPVLLNDDGWLFRVGLIHHDAT